MEPLEQVTWLGTKTTSEMLEISAGSLPIRAPVAQWIERLPPEQKVEGPIPFRGTLSASALE